MIKIIKTKLVEDEDTIDLALEQSYIKVSGINFSDKVDVYRIGDNNYYEIDLLSKELSEKELSELLKTNFDDFLTKEGKSVDYQALLPFETTTFNDFFDSFTLIMYFGKRSGKAFLRIQLAQDFKLENTKWEKYSPFYLYDKLIAFGKEKNYENLIISEGEDDTEELVRILFEFKTSDNIIDSLIKSFNFLPAVEKDFEKFMSLDVWTDDFEVNEQNFSKKLILPLLRKMKFDNVKYNHGKKEYGKDFLFSETNKFGENIYYGMQVKAGDISGEVNSEIDSLIGQLNDAFAMPFYRLGDQIPHYISSFIVATSGNFTENAKEKIIHKTPNSLKGNIFFWDKDKFLELIEKNWTK